MTRGEFPTLIAVVTLFVVGTGVGIVANTALGYDESVYAVLARHWVSGTPDSGWALHRPPLLSVLGVVPVVVAGGQEWAFRLIGAAFGVGTVLAAWWLARSIGGPVAGLLAAVTLAAASPLQLESGVFLTDVPSACLLIVLTALLWRQLRGADPINAGFLMLAPVAAAAFYLRYGAAVAIVALGIAAVATSGRRLAQSGRIVLATVVVFLLLILPHAAIATGQLGTPWGILLMAERGAAEASQQLPLAQYALGFPWEIIGPLGALLALAGLTAIIVAVGRRTGGRSEDLRERDRFAAFVGVTVLILMAVLGTIIHAEARYLLFVMALLVVLGSTTVAAFAARFSRARRRQTLVTAALIASALLVVGIATTGIRIHERAESWDWKRDVGRYVGTNSRGSCSVLTADVPIVSWYSRCPAITFGGRSGADRLTELTGQNRFLIVRADGHLQPSVDVLRAYLVGAEPLVMYVADGRPAATLYRIRP